MIGMVSTLSTRSAQQATISATHARLAVAADEVSTGRHHDVGLALGSGVGRAIDLRGTAREIEAVEASNGIVSARLSTMQAVLGELKDLADGFSESVITNRNAAPGSGRDVLIADARARLDRVVDLLGATSNGAHVFSGESTGTPPLAGYLAEPPGAARAAVQSAFAAEFGFAPDDAQAGSIDAAALGSYLDGAFATLFADPDWNATFSAASSRPIRDRISLDEVIETPVSADAAGVRDLVAALAAVVDSGSERLSGAAFETLTMHAARLAGRAADGLADSQAFVGMAERRVVDAGERLAASRGLIERQLGALEDVDAAEASTRLSLLSTQLEATYSATARLLSMSILDYL